MRKLLAFVLIFIAAIDLLIWSAAILRVQLSLLSNIGLWVDPLVAPMGGTFFLVSGLLLLTRNRKSPALLFCIAGVWLSVVALLLWFFLGGEMSGGIFFEVGGGRFAEAKIGAWIFVFGLFLIGWLIPLLIGLVRLVSQRSRQVSA